MPHYTPGGRFWRELYIQYTETRTRPSIEQFGTTSESEADKIYQSFFTFPDVRRLIMDAAQAKVFVDQSTQPPIAGRLRLPFDKLYLEFTDPIDICSPQPNRINEEPDKLLALMIVQTIERFETEMLEGGIDDRQTKEGVIHVTAFFRSGNGETYVDRAFKIDPTNGYGLTTMKSSSSRGMGFDDITHFDQDMVSPDTGEVRYHYAGLDAPVRTTTSPPGWWERTVEELARFTSWCLSFMTARGVVIVDMPLSRQVERAQKRAKHVPEPWHIVTVEPVRITREIEGGGSGRTVSYRHDVRGHLREARHRLKDGSIRVSVEWVRPHQRGLRHNLYVPSTHILEKKDLG